MPDDYDAARADNVDLPVSLNAFSNEDPRRRAPRPPQLRFAQKVDFKPVGGRDQ